MKKIAFIFFLVVLLSCFSSCHLLQIDFQNPNSPSYVSTLGISISQTNITGQKGDTILLSASVNPSNATNQFITWSSSDTSIVSVSSIGLVEFHNVGEAIITATTADGKEAYCYAKTLPVYKTISINANNWLDFFVLNWVDDGTTIYMNFSLNEEYKNATLSDVQITYTAKVHAWNGNDSLLSSYEKIQYPQTEILICKNAVYVYERYYIVNSISGTITYDAND